MDSLVGLGATRGFGVPGDSYLAVLDAMVDHANAFDLVLCRQEGGAAYMAAAWGKLTGEPGLCFVTRGPGATNATVGIHTAMQDSVPMLLFVGQVGTDVKGREAFQEVDYSAFFTPLAKWAVEIDDVDRVPELIGRAWAVAMSGRPGPVVVALPEDMLVATSTSEPCGPVTIPEPAPSAAIVSDMQQSSRSRRETGHPSWGNAVDGGQRPQAVKTLPPHMTYRSSPPSGSMTSSTMAVRHMSAMPAWR